MIYDFGVDKTKKNIETWPYFVEAGLKCST